MFLADDWLQELFRDCIEKHCIEFYNTETHEFFYCPVMPLLILNFDTRLFLIYIVVLLPILIWILRYINIRCHNMPS